MSFTHLHLHTLYSLLDGAIRMKDLIKTVKEKGMSSVAVTDHGNMFATIDFYKKAKDAGIKPIVGMEAYVAGTKGREDRTEKVAHHLILVAQNAEGYANLRYLASKAYMDGFYYHPRIDKKLLAEHSKGLFALTACLGGEVTSACFRGDMDHARKAALEYKNIFEPGHFFLEVQSNGMPEQDKANENLKQLGRDLDIPLCATADAHYIKREDARAHELLMCIASGKTLADGKRMKHSTDKLYVTSPQEMLEFFKDTPEAVHNTQVIAEQCNLELKLGKPMLPTFKVPESHTPDSFMAELAFEGLHERFKELHKAGAKFDVDAYRARLNLEIGVIQKMGFSGYFLIVQDFINWAKKHTIPVGPGRGSGAGSLVAYALRITDLDPIPYNLLFERFLNPERVSMPDFDIDFCQDRRDEVIKYVSGKYGENNVGQIITFGSLKAKSVLRDVCRVFALPFSEGDRIAKLVPEVLNITLKEAIETEPRLKEMIEKPSNIGEVEGKPVTTKDVLEIALALEGLHRQPGMHAAGVVIADKPLWEFVPVYQPPGEKTLITQFAKDEVEAAGLVKFDFLGLKTLTVIQNALDLINRNHPKEKPLEREDIPLHDDKMWELMAQGDTAGVFQMESSGFTEMVMKLKPSCFEDVIAAGALYRPGPLDSGMVDVFINRKHGREPVTYPHPALEPVLKDTYGVIVYQEQVMQISQVLGGYTLGRADLLRRAMGKKKAEVMQAERAGFLEGCKKNNVDLKVAGEIFDLMEKFAEYGFNKSHSAAYGLITIHTAWLKAHYKVEFMAALLTSEKDNTDKVVRHIGEARESGTQVLPPDVNQSDMAFGAVDGKIRFGLGAIKGVGEGAIEAIVEARKEGPFKGLFDFCERVDGRRVNRKVLEALVKAGAFDFEKRPRRQLFETIERALNRGSASQKDKAAGQSSLFGMLAGPSSGGGAAMKDDFAAVEEWVEKERLSYEKEAIGFYVSGHPLYAYEKELKRYARPVTAVQRARRDDKISVGGIIAAMRERPTKTGKRMAWVTLEDLSGSIELVCFPGKDGTRSVMGKDGKWSKQGPKPGYEHWEPLLKGDDPILVTGTVQISQRDEDAPTAELIVEDIQSLKAVREKRTKRLELRVPADLLTEEKLAKLLEIAKKNAGATPVAVSVLFPGEAEALIGGTQLKVQVNDELLLAVDKLFGMKVVELG
ncbi:DNA polymerase III subunit alpha [Hyalangium minutum]|uniref:DNA polymerase III subunit alpha n=1 Tax=Hyalangium minutum TaxID=394096 RepID=A0A085W5F0_9BACT|nr:DNA polymerase III subunit alpha [Hyalangium minutum]KFE62913.1 DNA polymerase III alpha subunit protein [Hyalangium minutum]